MLSLFHFHPSKVYLYMLSEICEDRNLEYFRKWIHIIDAQWKDGGKLNEYSNLKRLIEIKQSFGAEPKKNKNKG